MEGKRRRRRRTTREYRRATAMSTKQKTGKIQEDNSHSNGVASGQSEEPERGAVDGSDARNDAKTPCVEGRPAVEDSVDCAEEI